MTPTEVKRWTLTGRDVWVCVALVLAGAALWLPGLGRRGLWTPGEARVGQVARQMVTSSDFVTMRLEVNEPHLTVASSTPDTYDPEGDQAVYLSGQRRELLWKLSDGPLRPELVYKPRITIHKPVFYYWLVAMPARWLGMPINALTLRCFAAVPAILLLPLTYLFGCTLYGRRSGLIGAVALATCVHFYWTARVSQMDTLLTLLVTLSIACWYWGYRSERRSVSLSCFLVFYVSLAAASLTKSFAYMLLVGLIVLVWLAAEYWTDGRRGIGGFARHVWHVMRRMHIGSGLVLYLVLVVPWFYAIHVRTDGQYTAEMFGRHMFARAGLVEYGQEFENDTDWWFYLPRMFADLFPWIIMVPGALVHIFRARTRATQTQSLLLFCWFGVWLLFFSTISYRKNDYIMPLYPAAMLLVGKLLADHSRFGLADPAMNRAIRAGFVGIVVALVVMSAFGLALLAPSFENWLTTSSVPGLGEPLFGGNRNDTVAFEVLGFFGREHLATAIGGITLLVTLGVGCAVLELRRHTLWAFGLLAAATAVTMLVATHLFMDRLIDPFRSQRQIATALARLAPEQDSRTHVLLMHTEQHELAFLLPNRLDSVPAVLSPREDEDWTPRLLFALRSRLAALEGHRILVVMERDAWERLKSEQIKRQRGDQLLEIYDVPLQEIDIKLPAYDLDLHREPLIILEVTSLTGLGLGGPTVEAP